MANALVTIEGRRLGQGRTLQLTSNGIDITQPCVDATITVAAENTNVRAITIQLKDARGAGPCLGRWRNPNWLLRHWGSTFSITSCATSAQSGRSTAAT